MGCQRQDPPSQPCSQISCEAPGRWAVMMQGVAPSPGTRRTHPGVASMWASPFLLWAPSPPGSPWNPGSPSCTARASGSFPAALEGSRFLHLHRKACKRPWGWRRCFVVSKPLMSPQAEVLPPLIFSWPKPFQQRGQRAVREGVSFSREYAECCGHRGRPPSRRTLRST